MKIYDFTNRKREFGRVAFALTLDKKRMTERVIIGTADEVRRSLEYDRDEGDVYYDETRTLGNLLINFESDTNGEWNKNGMLLRESYGGDRLKPVFEKERWKMVAPASEFLRLKYNSGEPSVIFAAIRTWDEYLNLHKRKDASDTLTGRLSMLYKPFMVYGEYKPWDKNAVNALSVALRGGESNVELWYPVKNRLLETVVTASSFLPIIFYCMNKLNEWGYNFRHCKVCNKYFLAKSRHYELCSDDCRKQKAVEAKQIFNEKAKSDAGEKLYDVTYQYWYNRRRSLRKTNPSAVAAFEVEMRKFCEKAVKRKKALKNAEIDAQKDDATREDIERAKKLLHDFKGWLPLQHDEADRIFDELKQKRHDV